jgi:hypothetical protein
VRDLRHEAVYPFGAVCPARDAGTALVLPTVSAAAMQVMLDELGQAVAPDAHAVVLMDRVGWHVAHEPEIPANLTPVFLPAYSPELNAIERVWLYLRERFLSHRLWPSYDDILDACFAAWNALVEDARRICSLCTLDWAAPVSSLSGWYYASRRLPDADPVKSRRVIVSTDYNRPPLVVPVCLPAVGSIRPSSLERVVEVCGRVTSRHPEKPDGLEIVKISSGHIDDILRLVAIQSAIAFLPTPDSICVFIATAMVIVFHKVHLDITLPSSKL